MMLGNIHEKFEFRTTLVFDQIQTRRHFVALFSSLANLIGLKEERHIIVDVIKNLASGFKRDPRIRRSLKRRPRSSFFESLETLNFIGKLSKMEKLFEAQGRKVEPTVLSR